MATAVAPRMFKNFINGEWVESRSGQAYENRNPANTDELIGMFVSSTSEDVDAAVDAAKEAYKTWRLVPAPKRAEILYRAAELLVQRKEEFSKDMTREMGKVLAETRGDVQEAIDMTYYMAGEGRRLFGQTTPSELPNKFAMSVRQSIGVCGMITPWNFPMAIPSWKMMPALVSGNTVVLKPAEDTPLSSYHLVQILDGSRLAARRGESGERRWARTRARRCRSIRCAGGQLYGFDGGGTDHCAGLRAGFQALQPGNGRQKHHHRDGRRQSGFGGGWRGVGRLRHHRTALHGGQPRGGTQERVQGIRVAVCRAREVAASRRWPGRDVGHGTVHQRAATEDGDELRGDRQETKARSC